MACPLHSIPPQTIQDGQCWRGADSESKSRKSQVAALSDSDALFTAETARQSLSNSGRRGGGGTSVRRLLGALAPTCTRRGRRRAAGQSAPTQERPGLAGTAWSADW